MVRGFLLASLLGVCLFFTASSAGQKAKEEMFFVAHKRHIENYDSFVIGSLENGPRIALYAKSESSWQKTEVVLVARDSAGLKELTLADEVHELSVSLPLRTSQEYYEDRLVPARLFGPLLRKRCDCPLMEFSAVAVNNKGKVMRAAITISTLQ